ncbi:MAG: ABC transporter ATP-binding protein [Actinobacteria bacterium]|nr:ABC transporter ATP-binding protein [Actinomycetota bacterium]MBU1944648.1 ABC transporter ATP-binding protein [Actinomycetota bacterium]MBU2689196.1 ABC transporter ATP-binding protein [Actinomycetota bacterium]
MLRVDKLSTFYGNIQALRDVTIRARRGQITTIIGANGAGKTTLLRTVSGLNKARHGLVIYEDRDITNMQPSRIVHAGISQVPQGRQVFGEMTVGENLALGAYVRRFRERGEIEDDRRMVYELFPVLEERASQVAGTLSGGEQQMLAVGRALMSHPRLLLLDEPSMGLAPKVIQSIFRTLLALHEQGLTILLVEQDAKIALETADYGYVMRTGKVALEGEAGELLENEEVKRIYLG